MKHTISKKVTSIILAVVMVVGLIPAFSQPAEAYSTGGFANESFENGQWVREVYSWDDFDNAFKLLYSNNMFEFGHVTIKLMGNLHMNSNGIANNAAYMKNVTIGSGQNIVFDFNGYIISGEDTAGASNYDYSLQDFLHFTVNSGSVLTFEDSRDDDGGIIFTSQRAVDNGISALHIEAVSPREKNSDPYTAKVIFNGGSYKLNAEIEDFSIGTSDEHTHYRGTVIADNINVEINDGSFIAQSLGVWIGSNDFCSRELAAFATVISDWQNFKTSDNPNGEVKPFEEKGNTIINGGYFASNGFPNGYAIHHFDNTLLYVLNGLTGGYNKPLNVKYHTNIPTIRGGVFVGQMGFTGPTFTYSDGISELNNRPAKEIIPEDVFFCGKLSGGSTTTDITGLDWDDLHDIQSCVVFSETAVNEMVVTPNPSENGYGEPTDRLVRTERDTDTFKLTWKLADWANTVAGVQVVPKMGYQLNWESNNDLQMFSEDTLTIDYSQWDFYKGLTIVAQLMISVGDETGAFGKSIEIPVEVLHYFDVTWVAQNMTVSVVPEILQGETLAFKVEPKPNFEFVDENAIEVTVNDEPVERDTDSVYRYPNVQDDIQISVYAEMKGFTNFNIVVAGETIITSKVYKGDTFTLPTLEELGYNMTENTTFDYWKVSGIGKYQQSESFTVTTTKDITVTAVFSGYHPIEMEGDAVAYADEEYTQPISNGKYGTWIYIVAPEVEGMQFAGWDYEMMDGASSSPYFDDALSSETCFYMPDNGIILRPIYVTPIDDITFYDVVKPVIGEEFVLNHDGYYANYTDGVKESDSVIFDYSYWYHIVDGEEVSMKGGETFEAGEKYRYKTSLRANLTNGYDFPFDINDLNVTIEDIPASKYNMTIEYTDRWRSYLCVTVDFTCGITMSGTVAHFGGIDSMGRVVLTLPGEATAQYTALARRGSYSITGIEADTYVASFLLTGHTTRNYLISLKDDITFKATLRLTGDATMDGVVDVNDYQQIVNKALSGNNIVGADHTDDAEYAKALSDIDGDGVIDVIDCALAWNKINYE